MALETTAQTGETLLSNGSATGSAVTWKGGVGHLSVEAGTWNSATAKLQYKSINGTWIDVGSDATFTADGGARVVLGYCDIRLEITGSPTGVYAYIRQVGR